MIYIILVSLIFIIALGIKLYRIEKELDRILNKIGVGKKWKIAI